MENLNRQAAEYFSIIQQIEALQAEAEAIKESFRAEMVSREAEEINGNGWRATWHNTTITKFDGKAFKAAHGDMYTAFCRPVSGTRFTLNRVCN